MSRYNIATESYTTPENLGFPYNSPGNEYLFVLDETHQIGYLATDRFAGEGRVHVYSFAIPQQKQYWRNIAVDSLVVYARLEAFEVFTKDPMEIPILMKENTDEIGDFCFIMNDSVVYHSLSDFQHVSAQEKYLAWKKSDEQYRNEQEQLADLRQQYATADEATKNELTSTILQLENNQSQLLKCCQFLLQEIRQIEMSAQ